ncbi:CBO0543 family protein [Paenibacillus aestuarii]|uniref:CBO0543 family protein n=1 Tax=Paenibacillus aestuarii TaxID=516965 RepID=A0ABW0K8N0_9BACL|nr:CBO0543 family protein [Paenibacillus aestuarii]
MNVDRATLAVIWILGITILFFIPAAKRREAFVAFLACQCLTWFDSMMQVQFGLISFPVREFPKATDLLVTSEFFMYPYACGLYFINKPKARGTLFKISALMLWVTCLTGIDLFLVNFTHLISYDRYAWYWSWLDFLVTFILADLYSEWFLKRFNKLGEFS